MARRRIGSGLARVTIAVMVGFTLPNPVAAQQPVRGILVSPRVACRAAPLSSAIVVGNLTKTGHVSREGVTVGDSATDRTGARWVSVEMPQGPLGRCWVPEPTVVADSGADALLAMADHLLAAPEGYTPHDWVAVHNYFGSPRYREEVDASAVLTLRRLEVLMVALRLVHAGWGELDPRAVAWLESLGEDVEYSPNRRGGMRWVVSRDTLEGLYDAHRDRGGSAAAPPGDGAGGGGAGERVEVEDRAEMPAGDRDLAVIAPGVSCRSAPSRTARGYSMLGPSEHFSTDRPDTVVDGEAWVSVPNWACWVPRSLTAPAGSEDHLLAIADQFLASGQRRTLDHTLRIFNLLNGRHHGYRAVVDGSALLTLRRLQMLGEVLATISTFSADALTRGWAAQMEEVRMWSIGASWYVRDEAFEKAFEDHRDSPRAEDILWALATGPAPHDCEGEFACTARVVVMNRLARHWTEYPNGSYVARAVEIAAGRLSGFLETCRTALGAEQESREARWWEYVYWEPRGAATAREIRASLREVADANRAPLVELLDGLDRCAAEISSGADQNRSPGAAAEVRILGHQRKTA